MDNPDSFALGAHNSGSEAENYSDAAPPDSAGPSPIGSLDQYKPAERWRNFDNETSVTGATLDDPARKLIRLPFGPAPEWTSPLNGFKSLVDGFLTSWLIYWFGYGPLLVAFSKIFLFSFGEINAIPRSLPGAMILCGPYYGLRMDWNFLVNSGAALSFAGAIMLVLDALFFVTLFFCHHWSGRLKAGFLLAGLIAAKGLIFALGNGPL